MLAHGDHFAFSVHAFGGEAERLTLAETGPSAEQDQECVTMRHGVSQGDHVGWRKEPDKRGLFFWKPDIVTRSLAYIAIPNGRDFTLVILSFSRRR